MNRPWRRRLLSACFERRPDLFAVSAITRCSRGAGSLMFLLKGMLSVAVALSCGGLDRVVGLLSSPDGPHDPGELVGQGHGGFVVDVCGADSGRPLTESVLVVAGAEQDGAGAVDEQRSEVTVSAFGDASEVTLEATGVLARGEAEVAGEVPARGKAPGVDNEGDERSRGQ